MCIYQERDITRMRDLSGWFLRMKRWTIIRNCVDHLYCEGFHQYFRIDSCIQGCSGLISSIREKNRGERSEGDKTSEILRWTPIMFFIYMLDPCNLRNYIFLDLWVCSPCVLLPCNLSVNHLFWRGSKKISLDLFRSHIFSISSSIAKFLDLYDPIILWIRYRS